MFREAKHASGWFFLFNVFFLNFLRGGRTLKHVRREGLYRSPELPRLRLTLFAGD